MKRRDFIAGASVWLASCSSNNTPTNEKESDVPYAVKKTANVAYGTDPLHRLDQYVPVGAKGPLASVVCIIGGTFTSATLDNKTKFDTLCKELAKRGYNAFTISYRGLKQNVYADTMADVRLAVDWVKSRSFVNPAKVCTWGQSAGSFMAVWMASEARVAAAVCGAGPFDLDSDEAQTRVGAWFGAVDRHTLSPLFSVTSGHKPVFLLHGTADKTVPYAQSVAYAAALKAANVPYVYRSHSGGHGIPTGTLGSKIFNEQMAFIKRYVG